MDFETAIAFTLKWEKGYANVKADSGGETYAGIARHKNPQWPGWKVVDELRPLPAFPHTIVADPRIGPLVIGFYRASLWALGPFQDFNSDHVGIAAFDLSLPFGFREMSLILQRAINACGLKVDVDGCMGAKTVAAANAVFPADLVGAIKSEAGKVIAAIEVANPEDKLFDKGWRDRIASY